jgi:hypothetical protein
MLKRYIKVSKQKAYVGALSRPSDGWPRFMGIDIMDTLPRSNATDLLMLNYKDQWE